MANDSIHLKEQELKERLGKDYETETPPPGARIIGEDDVQEQDASRAATDSTAHR